MLKYSLYLINIVVFTILCYNLLRESNYTEKPRLKRKSNYQVVIINPIRGNIYDSKGIGLTKTNYTYKIVFKSKSSLLYDDENCTKYRNSQVTLCTVSIDYLYNNLELINLFDINIYPVFKRSKEFFDFDLDFIGSATFATGSKRIKIIKKIIRNLKKAVDDKILIKRFINKARYIDILVGNHGIELYYDNILRGRVGIAKKYRNKSIIVLGKRNGKDLYLTINLDLHNAIKNELKKFCKNLKTNCFVIGINAKNGDILFFVETKKDNLEKNMKQFYFSNIYEGLYSPGSILKPFIALELLEAGFISKTTRNFCPGRITLYNRIFKCWASNGHGNVNVISALEHSCNIFFYQYIQKFSQNELRNFVRKLNLNTKTQVDLPYETLPRVNIPTNPLNKTLFSIGQIDIYISLLKLTQLFSLFHNKEYIPIPHILKNNNTKSQIKKIPIKVNMKNIEIVKEGLFKVIHSPSGTAYGLGLEKYNIYGKTGTVEVGAHLKPNSLFCGLLEASIPISFCVLIENSGTGKEFAGKFSVTLVDILVKFFNLK